MHLNLSSFVKNPFTNEAFLDKNQLYQVAYEATRLVDDLVDLEIDAVQRIIDVVSKEKDNNIEVNLWKKIKENGSRGRRAGLGFTSLSDTIAMLGFKYDSDESFDAIENIMRTIFKAQLDSEVDLAIERGSFEDYSKENEDKMNDWYQFVQKDFPNEYERMKKFKRRNLSWSTVAPTGCLTAKTKIKTSNGNLSLKEIFALNGINLEELQDLNNTWFKPNKDLFVFDVNGNEHKISNLYINGKSKNKVLTLADGETIECTSEHKFLVKVDDTKATWVKSEDLKKGDKIIKVV